ncbi:flavodoxin domain-containing protein [Marinobacter fonticola]|uniref:flavodoxin domain-containing protein n=1 Tax=Marinobacter fonticola TaxID=2603215 RepID=UPI0011E7111D|nr:flavodoxin domain-containing protein [Marinobacter fonticola]
MARIRILVGSVFGGALLTARELRKDLEQAEHHVVVLEKPSLDDITSNDDALLVCTSTTGQGEIPETLLPLYLELRDKLPLQQDRPFGVIVLGDSSYGDTFCGAGDLMEEVLYEIACRKVSNTLRIDALETVNPEQVALPWAREWAASLDWE